MQRFVFIGALALFHLMMAASLLAQSTADVRQVRWGFSPKQVRETEPVKPTSFRNEKLVYARVPLINRTVGLEYTFNGDSLLSASYYYYATAAVTEADVKAVWEESKTQLTEKYGPGKTARVGEIGTVVWFTPRTQISLALGNADRGWSVELVYLCRVCSGEPSKQASNPWKARKDIKDL